MKRGEVWWVDFDPLVGGEFRKQRRALVVSNDASNQHLNRVTLAGERRKAMADQLTTAGKQRLVRRAGAISRDDMEAVERAIRVQLGLGS